MSAPCRLTSMNVMETVSCVCVQITKKRIPSQVKLGGSLTKSEHGSRDLNHCSTGVSVRQGTVGSLDIGRRGIWIYTQQLVEIHWGRLNYCGILNCSLAMRRWHHGPRQWHFCLESPGPANAMSLSNLTGSNFQDWSKESTQFFIFHCFFQCNFHRELV